jgi:hypothetical protein
MRRERVGVGIVIANRGLRELVRTDLERSGFPVIFALPALDLAPRDADVVVTESSGMRGRLLTVRITEALATPEGDPAIVLAADDLGVLPVLLRAELLERQALA